MNNIFLVPSGIYTKQTLFSVEDRINQTIETAIDIRKKVPDVKLYLLEGGDKSLSFDERSKFLEVYDDVLDFTGHEVIKFSHQLGGGTMKSSCETYMLMQSIKLLNVPEQSRIFKICGRYRLSDRFDLSKHHSATGKYLFKNKEPGLEFIAEYTKSKTSLYRYETRLFSFCGSIFDTVVKDFEKIFYSLIDMYSNNLYNDVEHMTYMVLDQSLVLDTDCIGVAGLRGEEKDSIIDE